MTYYSGTIFQDGAVVAINLVQSCQNSECSILEKTSNHIHILRAIHKGNHELLSKNKIVYELTDRRMDGQTSQYRCAHPQTQYYHIPKYEVVTYNSLGGDT